MTDARTGQKWLRLDARLPSKSELEEVERDGLGLYFLHLPADRRDWSFLEDYADVLRHLQIADGDSRDFSVLQKLSALRTLDVNVEQAKALDLSRLINLQEFRGPCPKFASVCDAPLLSRVAFQKMNAQSLHFKGPLHYVELIGANKLTKVPSLTFPDSIHTFWVYGSRSFDLAGAQSWTSLKVLDLERCAQITGVRALQNLALEGIAFDNITEIDDVDSLLELVGVEISVLGRNPFTATFRERAESSGSTWRYYGTARTPSKVKNL